MPSVRPPTPQYPDPDAPVRLRAAAFAIPPNVEPRQVIRAEVRCHLCGDLRGVLETEPGRAHTPFAVLLPAEGSATRLVAWNSLRCLRCGSRSLYVDEPETVVKRDESVDWSLDRPRRGRPPAWLVAARAQRAAA